MVDTLTPTTCCLRRNPSPRDKLNDNLCMLSVLTIVYFCLYVLKMDALTIASMSFIHMTIFHVGMNVNEVYNEKKEDIVVPELSLKQREHGATLAKAMTPEQEELLKQSLENIVEETRRRNERRVERFTRTPSNTTMTHNAENVEDTTDDEMPPLVPLYCYDSQPKYERFSVGHYLQSYMDDEYKFN